MNINATLIIQALNFFIVYWMLRCFLFKPIITIIERENTEEQALLDIISQQCKSLEIQEKERQRHWYICQEYFTTHRPYHPVAIFFTPETIETITPPIHELPDNEITHLVAHAHKTLEEKIKHVH